MTSDRDSLSEQLLTICQAQEAASNRLLKSEKTAREIRESLQEREEYIANLKRLVNDLRESQNKYTPQRVIKVLMIYTYVNRMILLIWLLPDI